MKNSPIILYCLSLWNSIRSSFERRKLLKKAASAEMAYWRASTEATRITALAIWEKASLAVIAAARNHAEARDAYLNAPKDTDAESKGLQKMYFEAKKI